MSYAKQTWNDNDPTTPVSAARLSYIETGIESAETASQPVDSDLTAIAALATTSFGRSLLTQADASATRTTLGLGTAATTPATDYQPIDSDLTAIAALSTTSYGRALLTSADAAAARTALGAAGQAKRVVSLTDGATITPNADTTDIGYVTLGGNRTMANPTGTPVEGQQLQLRIKQDGTGSRTLTWGTAYRFSTDLVQPTLTTTLGKTDYLGFQYNGVDSKWDFIALTRGY